MTLRLRAAMTAIRNDGYALVPGRLDAQAVAELRAAVGRAVAGGADEVQVRAGTVWIRDA